MFHKKKNGNMDLKEYFDTISTYTVEEFAALCDISASSLYKWKAGRYRPSHKHARIISRMTENKVTFEELRKIKEKTNEPKL